MFCTSHFVIRALFDKQYHCGKTMNCLILTCTIAFFGISSTLPISVSIVSSIPICWIIAYIGYLVQYKIDMVAYTNELENKINALLEGSDNPKDKLLKLCADKNISERDTKIAVMYYIEHKKPKQILQWLCDNHENIEWDSLYILLNRLNKKLYK